MKKFLLLILILSSFFTPRAQTSVYHPFPDSAIVWRENLTGLGFNCCCSGFVCLHDEQYQYFLNGDTMIGAKVFKKLYKSGTWVDYIDGPPVCPPWCNNYTPYYLNFFLMGGIRQDTAQRKVFYIPPSSVQDTLLYDFSLNPGDTLPPSWNNYPSNYVSSVDSILIGNNYHKRFHLSQIGTSFSHVAIIEGIGSEYGLLFPLMPPFEFFNTLVCVTINSVPVYPDTATVCQLVSKINVIENNAFLSLSPNPFSNKMNITTTSNELSAIIIYDITSRKLLQQTFTNSTSINTTLLSKGIYLYEVRNKNGMIKKGKVIKE